MKRIGLRLLDLMSKAQKRRSALPRGEHNLKDSVVGLSWRAMVFGYILCWLLTVGAQVLDLSAWIRLPFLALAVMVFSGTLNGAAFRLVERHARARARRYQARRRVARVSAPYERMAPAASAPCESCPAQKGQRHRRDCPSIPAGWFS